VVQLGSTTPIPMIAPLAAPHIYGNASATFTGWTLGGGLEYAFQRNWSAFIEYNYMDLGSQDITLSYNTGSTYRVNYKHDLQTVLFGLNYRFGGI
jgi:outer membrane immunogenic protein